MPRIVTLYAPLLILMIIGIATAQEKSLGAAPHPQLVERLSATEFDSRFAATAAVTKESIQLAKSLRPAVGLIVKVMAEGSPADELGLREGDLLARINGAILWSADSMGAQQRRSLEFFSVASQKMRTIKLPPGKIGISTIEYWRPEWAYLRSKSAKATWDPEAVAGITMASIDPDLAETAWTKAFQKGYQADSYSATAALEIALARGDSTLAADAIAYLHRFEADNAAIFHPVLRYRYGMANGQLDEMRLVVEKFPHIIPIDVGKIGQLMDLQIKNPPIRGDTLDSLAKSYLRDNQIPRLMGYWRNDVEFSLPDLQQNRPLTLEASPGGRDALLVSPSEPTPNVDISFKFSWEPQHEGNNQFHPNIRVALVDNTTPHFGLESSGEYHPALVSYTLVQSNSDINELGTRTLETRALLEHFPMGRSFRFVDPSIQWGPQKNYSVRIIKCGGQVELQVDNRRLVALPLDPSVKQLALEVMIVSSKATLHDFHFDELIEDASK